LHEQVSETQDSLPQTSQDAIHLDSESLAAIPNVSYRLTLPQVQPSSIVLEGHRDSVNAIKFNADLCLLLSGGTSFFLLSLDPQPEFVALDNSGSLIVWDLAVRDRLQTIDASFAGPVTSLCWISLYKSIAQAREDPAPAFAVGFATGTIGIYRKNSDNVRCLTMAFDLIYPSLFLFSAAFRVYQDHRGTRWTY
jgi:WD40 repeat protein